MAIPLHAPSTSPSERAIKVRLLDGTELALSLADGKALRAMTYFKGLEDVGMWGAEDGAVPIPCKDAFVFKQLVHLVTHRDLPRALLDPATDQSPQRPTHENLADVMRMGDLLGAPEFVQSCLARGMPRLLVDMHDICPGWWLAQEKDHHAAAELHQRMMMMMEGGSGSSTDWQGRCVNVTDDMVKELVYLPLSQDERWLFRGRMRPPSIGAGEQVLRACPAECVTGTITAYHPGLIGCLRAHAGRLVIAGGAVLGSLSRACKPGTDVDIFVCAKDNSVEDAQRTFASAQAYLLRTWCNHRVRAVRTGWSTTMVF